MQGAVVTEQSRGGGQSSLTGGLQVSSRGTHSQGPLAAVDCVVGNGPTATNVIEHFAAILACIGGSRLASVHGSFRSLGILGKDGEGIDVSGTVHNGDGRRCQGGQKVASIGSGT